MLLSFRGALYGGHGHNILLSLRVNHKEDEFYGLGNDLTAFLPNDQRDGGRRCYLWYPIQLIFKSNNNSVSPTLIHVMSLPQVWLS